MSENLQVNGLHAQGLPTPRHAGVDALSTVTRALDITSHQRDVALIWARRGIPVVPCSRTDKGALVPGFGKNATAEELAKFADLDQITAWWSGRFKRAHVGLLTRSLVVVDLDQAKPDSEPLGGRWSDCVHGTDVLEQLVREAGAEWPETYTVVTPSGGLHLYFTQPEGEPIGCSTGEGTTAPHLGPLVDVRGVGGYVIAAGSYSAAQGRPYERVTPAALGPQPLPAWLLQLFRPAVSSTRTSTNDKSSHRAPVSYSTRAERYAEAALRGAADDIVAAPAKEGNATLYARARRLGEISGTAPRVLTLAAVEDALLPAAEQRGHSAKEALGTIRSGWNRGCGAQVSAA